MSLHGFVDRLMGLEVEYRVATTASPHAAADYKWWAAQLFNRRVDGWAVTSEWLPNGGRLYRDSGHVLETNTPEVNSGRLAVVYDRAQEQLVMQRLGSLRSAAGAHSVALWREVRQGQHGINGVHENYLVDDGTNFEALARQLGPFWATRQLIGGAGLVVRHTLGWSFLLSQRAPHIVALTGGGTLNNLGLVRRINDPLATNSRYRRLEVMVGDANILAEPAVAKYDLALLVLLLRENGRLPHIDLDNPVSALRETNHLGPRAKLVNCPRQTLTAVQVQWLYLEAAAKLCEEYGLRQFAESLSYWAHVLDRLEANDLAALNGRVDWVTKRLALQENGDNLSYEDAHDLDRDYHALLGGSDWPHRLRAAHDPAGLAADVTTACTQAPPGRPALRAALLALAEEIGADYTPDWDTFRMWTALTDHTISMRDPYHVPADALAAACELFAAPVV